MRFYFEARRKCGSQAASIRARVKPQSCSAGERNKNGSSVSGGDGLGNSRAWRCYVRADARGEARFVAGFRAPSAEGVRNWSGTVGEARIFACRKRAQQRRWRRREQARSLPPKQ